MVLSRTCLVDAVEARAPDSAGEAIYAPLSKLLRQSLIPCQKPDRPGFVFNRSSRYRTRLHHVAVHKRRDHEVAGARLSSQAHGLCDSAGKSFL